MMTAGQYGNAGAYFTGSQETGFMLGLRNVPPGKRPVAPYSVVRMGDQGLTTVQRIAAPSAAIIGWLGLRPVAFPLVTGWNWDTPIT